VLLTTLLNSARISSRLMSPLAYLARVSCHSYGTMP
tara:strand:- start:86859 stop:86966 length:108 start_codon:yes stop_codon:yes gene_type:complete